MSFYIYFHTWHVSNISTDFGNSIGRITGRLPKQLADEVVGALMELFSPTESESAWHGGKSGIVIEKWIIY